MKTALIKKRDKKGRFIGNKIYKQYYCKICKKPIYFMTALYGSGLCRSCATKKQLKNPKNSGRFKDGFYTKKRYCIDCKKELKSHNRAKYCKKCIEKYKIYPDRKGKNSSSFGKPKSNITKEKISKKLQGHRITKSTRLKLKEAHKKIKFNNHHLDLNIKNNRDSNIYRLKKGEHQLFHRFAYHYLLEKFGIKKILKYKKWFKKYLKMRRMSCQK